MQKLAGIITEAVEVPTWLKGKLEDVHVKPGQGSIFAKPIDNVLKLAQDTLDKTKDIDKIANSTGTLTVKSPGIGYNLVLPIEQAKKLPGAKEIEVEKVEGPNKIKVHAITTTAPLTQFKSDELTIIVRPKKDEAGAVIPNEYIVLSAFPGDPSIPRASEWGKKYAVIIPDSKEEIKEDILETVNKVLSKHRKQLKEEKNTKEFLFEISDDEIKKAAAAALNTPINNISDNKPSEEKKIDEEAITLAITIAGLIPPALNLVGNIANKAKQMFGLSDEEKKELDKLNTNIKKAENLVNTFDNRTIGNNPEEERSIKLLNSLKKQKDEKFGTKIGNMAKHAGHSLHEAYTFPIRKMLQFVAWTSEKFGKKTKLSDEKYREKLANIIYAVAMLSIAGYGIASHITHLTGVGPVITTLADGVKAGKSIVDIVKDVALSI
jgi:hypothetical protein